MLRTSDGGVNWVVIARLNRENEGSLGDIGFVDAAHGWMVSPSALWLTQDGGATWHGALPSMEVYRSPYFCSFLDADNGWLSGSGGAFYRTQDGGHSWQFRQVGSGREDLREVCFLNASFGWTFSVTPPRIFFTFDGGDSWEAKSAPTGASGLLSVSFVSAREGWTVAILQGTAHETGRLPPNTLLNTSDGGQTWNNAGIGKDEPNLHRVHFLDSAHGWLLGASCVYRTSDGGQNWNVVLSV